MAGGAGRAGDSTRGEKKAQLIEPKRFLFFILHTFLGDLDADNRNGSFFLFFTRFLGDLRCGQPKRFLFFFLHTFFRGPVIFSIESHSFVCLELVLKLHNPTFFRQLIVLELLYSTT